MRLDQGRLHAKFLAFRAVAVGDEGALQKSARSRDGCELGAQQAPRARLGDGERESARAEQVGDDLAQRAPIVAEHSFAQRRAQPPAELREERLGLVFSAGGRQAQLHLTRRTQDRRARVGGRLVDRRRQLLDLALRQTGDTQNARAQYRRPGASREHRAHVGLEHRAHLERWTWQQEHELRAVLDTLAGSCAVLVAQHASAVDDVGLFLVDHAHRPATRGEARSQRIEDRLIALHRPAERRGRGLACEIVLSRPEPARGDDHVGACERRPERGLDQAELIGDRLARHDVYPDRAQVFGQKRPIGLLTRWLEQLAADGQDLGLHYNHPNRRITWRTRLA